MSPAFVTTADGFRPTDTARREPSSARSSRTCRRDTSLVPMGPTSGMGECSLPYPRTNSPPAKGGSCVIPTSDLPELRWTRSHHVAPASTRPVREPSASDVAIWLGQKVQASTPSNRLGHRDAVASMASRRRRSASTRRARDARLCAWLGGLERRARRPLISSAQWRRGKFTSASALRDPLGPSLTSAAI